MVCTWPPVVRPFRSPPSHHRVICGNRDVVFPGLRFFVRIAPAGQVLGLDSTSSAPGSGSRSWRGCPRRPILGLDSTSSAPGIGSRSCRGCPRRPVLGLDSTSSAPGISSTLFRDVKLADDKDFCGFRLHLAISPLIFTILFDLLRIDEFFMRSNQAEF